MKWPQEQIAIIVDGFNQWIDSHGGLESVKEALGDDRIRFPMVIAYRIYRMVNYDLQYDDDHPAYSDTIQDGIKFTARVRRVRYNPSFQLYPDGCSDKHLATMLKSVMMQCSLDR